MLSFIYLFGYKLFLSFLGIIGLGFLIAFHEMGHFLFCKLFGIYTPSFSIGFGPILISRKIGHTLFKISAIPLGGYVEIAGSNEVGQGDQEHAYAKDTSSFASKPYWQKLCVMLGGILFNLFFAYAMFITIFWLGAPKTNLLYPTIAKPVVAEVLAGSLAEQYGIQKGDKLISINDTTQLTDSINPLIAYLDQIKPATMQPGITHTTDYLRLELEHNGERYTVDFKPEVQEMRGRIIAAHGIVFEMHDRRPLPFGQAFWLGIFEVNRWIKNTFKDFLYLFKKKDVGEMAGPLMIIAMSSKWAGEGFMLFLLFLAIISINLAVLNLIPIPILDGGQILFHTIEAIIRRPIPERIRYYIHMVCWIAFLALFIYLSWYDIVRIVRSLVGK